MMGTKESVMWGFPEGLVASQEQELLSALNYPQETQDPLPQLELHSEELRASGLPVSWEVHDETTADVALVAAACDQPIYYMPPSPVGPPSRGNFTGPLNFEVQVNGEDTNKKKYLYSHQLNRIYVDMSTGFPVQFRWQWDMVSQPLLVRATTVFSGDSHAEQRVERCLQHVHPSNNNAVSGDACYHVLQSTREAGAEGVHYCGAPADPLSWFSVAVRLPPRPDAGAEHFSHVYVFRCKNTCCSGINRRAIEILFTLEDAASGEVLGRQAVGVRVCSCPRRDQKKDEEATPPPPGKRRRAPAAVAAAAPAPPPGKRVKLEPDDDDDDAVYVLPVNLQIAGRKTYKAGLTLFMNYMIASASQCTDDNNFQVYGRCIEQVKTLLEQHELARQQ